jgi:hypothetical protein
MEGRYQQILLPCEATSKSYHNKVVASANSLIELWETLQRALNHDQVWVIRDTKLNKSLTREEFHQIITKIKGWDKYD